MRGKNPSIPANGWASLSAPSKTIAAAFMRGSASPPRGTVFAVLFSTGPKNSSRHSLHPLQ
ncbi:hypothetical protein [Mesorhizobium sp.]|uniref:hypothetical protein n=1 Tax=Mesorhizobium sp. TaxID=1871066 RepID=UPI0025C5A562|nr:hypothetical protein [Mesorhizobium sp.]